MLFKKIWNAITNLRSTLSELMGIVNKLGIKVAKLQMEPPKPPTVIKNQNYFVNQSIYINDEVIIYNSYGNNLGKVNTVFKTLLKQDGIYDARHQLDDLIYAPSRRTATPFIYAIHPALLSERGLNTLVESGRGFRIDVNKTRTFLELHYAKDLDTLKAVLQNLHCRGENR